MGIKYPICEYTHCVDLFGNHHHNAQQADTVERVFSATNTHASRNYFYKQSCPNHIYTLDAPIDMH